jgi:cytidylate kinase
MSSKRIIVAIDGPAGAGKSTIARRIADRLGFVYINTGAMYRAVALWALRNQTELTDMHRLEKLAWEAKITFCAGDGRVILNGEDVTDLLYTPEVSSAASIVSAVPGVRKALLPMQRQIAENSSVVMEGRDIGSVVFPEAQVKVFLDANPRERARRRSLELNGTEHTAGIESVASAIEERDGRDRTRREAPLVQAPDAELIDTTALTVEQVEDEILRLVRSRTSNGKEVHR